MCSRGDQSFLGPFRYQVPLDFGEQSEQGDHDLGLQVLLAVKLDSSLYLAKSVILRCLLEALEAQRQPVPVRSVLGAAWQMDGFAMKAL